jgi:hypothetical protein
MSCAEADSSSGPCASEELGPATSNQFAAVKLGAPAKTGAVRKLERVDAVVADLRPQAPEFLQVLDALARLG